MKPEELLQMLRDGGMEDEAIKGLLSEAIAALAPNPAPEEGHAEPAEEGEEAKMNRVFGI